MSQINTVTAYDGLSTPVLHTFQPVSITRNGDEVVAVWRETGLAVPMIAQPTLTLKLRRLKNGVWRTERRIVVPVMESVSGQNAAGYTAAPKVAHEVTDIRIGYYHERSSNADRKLARMIGVNLDNGVTTSVAAGAGYIAELIDMLVMPT